MKLPEDRLKKKESRKRLATEKNKDAGKGYRSNDNSYN